MKRTSKIFGYIVNKTNAILLMITKTSIAIRIYNIFSLAFLEFKRPSEVFGKDGNSINGSSASVIGYVKPVLILLMIVHFVAESMCSTFAAFIAFHNNLSGVEYYKLLDSISILPYILTSIAIICIYAFSFVIYIHNKISSASINALGGNAISLPLTYWIANTSSASIFVLSISYFGCKVLSFSIMHNDAEINQSINENIAYIMIFCLILGAYQYIKGQIRIVSNQEIYGSKISAFLVTFITISIMTAILFMLRVLPFQ